MADDYLTSKARVVVYDSSKTGASAEEEFETDRRVEIRKKTNGSKMDE